MTSTENIFSTNISSALTKNINITHHGIAPSSNEFKSRHALIALT